MYADHNQDGSVFCWIGGGTCAEQAIFLRALRDVLSPIENPRYLLARRKIWRIFREDYFACTRDYRAKEGIRRTFCAALEQVCRANSIGVHADSRGPEIVASCEESFTFRSIPKAYRTRELLEVNSAVVVQSFVTLI